MRRPWLAVGLAGALRGRRRPGPCVGRDIRRHSAANRHHGRAACRRHGGHRPGRPDRPPARRRHADPGCEGLRAGRRAGAPGPEPAERQLGRRLLRHRDHLGVRGLPALARVHRSGRQRAARHDVADEARAEPVHGHPHDRPGREGPARRLRRRRPYPGDAHRGRAPARLHPGARSRARTTPAATRPRPAPTTAAASSTSTSPGCPRPPAPPSPALCARSASPPGSATRARATGRGTSTPRRSTTPTCPARPSTRSATTTSA